MTAIFAKTRKGQEEIEQRSGGLGPRPRRVLILIDGKRPLDEVRAMMPDPRLDEALAQLQEEGYIERIGGGDPPPPAAVEEAVVACRWTRRATSCSTPCAPSMAPTAISA